MKKAISFGLSLLLFAVALMPLAAPADDSALQNLMALGVMSGDKNGNMNLDRNITRAEFAKMVVLVSPIKDSVGDGGASLFSDVKAASWSAKYIAAATKNGIMAGYSDGTFRPDNGVKTAEGAAIALKLLGFTSADLQGVYPAAHMNKMESLGLGQNVLSKADENMKRSDAMHLLNNLLTAKTKTGVIYAQSLGYAVTSAGALDYSAAVTLNIKGPFISSGGDLQQIVPFNLENADIFVDGVDQNTAYANEYDVVYYNQNLTTVWVYKEKVIGLYTSALPNADSPTAVTVAGATYQSLSPSAQYKLSSLGKYSVGDTVTLLIGRNGTVVDVVDGNIGDSQYFGVVAAHATVRYMASGKEQTRDVIDIACTDGKTRQFQREENAPAVGKTVSVTVKEGKATVKTVTSKALSGTVDDSGGKLGDLAFAPDAKIIDAGKNGQVVTILPKRLAGYKISSTNILFWSLNEKGQINHLILNDATGDLHAYGVILSVEESSSFLGDFAVYRYNVAGAEGVSAGGDILGLSKGVYRLTFENGSIKTAAAIKETAVDMLFSTYGIVGTKTVKLADSCPAFVLEDGEYRTIPLSAIVNDDNYKVKGYADTYPLGGKIRVIVTTESNKSAK